jgi:hypothetical protein
MPVKLPRLAVFWLLLGWIFLALYPNPSLLVRSINNIQHPDIDAAAVRNLAATLPNDPKLIEQAVLDRIVPYAYDWQVNGVPWYFPTTAEVIKAKRGDCESRAVVLASILKAKGIPYQLLMSFDHIWVQYPGKQANALENPDVALAQRVNGHYVWHWPKDFHLGAEINAQLGMYWTPMPGLRKALMFIGLMMVLLINPVASATRRRAGYLDLSRLPLAKTGAKWTSPPAGRDPALGPPQPDCEP